MEIGWKVYFNLWSVANTIVLPKFSLLGVKKVFK